MTTFEKRLARTLLSLRAADNNRQLPRLQHQGIYVMQDGRRLLNLASNDYLGIASDPQIRASFMQTIDLDKALWSASASRLLTGNFEIYAALEERLATCYGKQAALVFNSGYHMNIGILPAICSGKTLILADRRIHASLIDGVRLSKGAFIRYPHGDYQQLEALLTAQAHLYEQVVIVTESVFSMDGDLADLNRLVELKRSFLNVLLYVDEAHAVGVMGATGLGLAQQLGCIEDIDFLVGTFGKALASMGGYLVCTRLIRDYLINKMRPLIYSTALPPIQLAWSDFVLSHLASLSDRRARLQYLSERLNTAFLQKGYPCHGDSHIVTVVLGSSEKALASSAKLHAAGFYLPAIRPPTVASGSARLRISLNAGLQQKDIDQLLVYL